LPILFATVNIFIPALCMPLRDQEVLQTNGQRDVHKQELPLEQKLAERRRNRENKTSFFLCSAIIRYSTDLWPSSSRAGL